MPDNRLQASKASSGPALSWPTPTPPQAEQAWQWLERQFEHRCIEVKHDTPGASEDRAKQHFNGFLERQLPQEYWPVLPSGGLYCSASPAGRPSWGETLPHREQPGYLQLCNLPQPQVCVQAYHKQKDFLVTFGAQPAIDMESHGPMAKADIKASPRPVHVQVRGSDHEVHQTP